MASVDVNSALIVPRLPDDTKPDVLVQANKVICHLSHNFSPNAEEDSKPPGGAYFAKGTVNFNVDSNDSRASGWGYGFVQLCHINGATYTYCGKTSDDGSVEINPSRALPRRLTLDTFDKQEAVSKDRPWLNDDADHSVTLFGRSAETSMFDHPTHSVETKTQNTTTKKDNFLSEVHVSCTFTTILTAQQPDKSLLHLAFFETLLNWHYKFTWQGGLLLIQTRDEMFKVLRNQRGAPPENPQAEFLNNIAGPNTNVAYSRARKAASVPGSKHRKELTVWPEGVPPIFWRD
jgi:hypothetical protein